MKTFHFPSLTRLPALGRPEVVGRPGYWVLDGAVGLVRRLEGLVEGLGHQGLGETVNRVIKSNFSDMASARIPNLLLERTSVSTPEKKSNRKELFRTCKNKAARRNSKLNMFEKINLFVVGGVSFSGKPGSIAHIPNFLTHLLLRPSLLHDPGLEQRLLQRLPPLPYPRLWH